MSDVINMIEVYKLLGGGCWCCVVLFLLFFIVVLVVVVMFFCDMFVECVLLCIVECNIGIDVWVELLDGLYVFFCGIGFLMLDISCVGFCIVVLVGDRVFVFDMGVGLVCKFV